MVPGAATLALAAMSRLQPTATSTLAATPLPKLLVHAMDRALTGTLVIETPAHEKSGVYFEKGAPAKVMTGLRVHFLGEVLQDLGLVDDATRQITLAQAVRERRLHGQVLLSTGKLGQTDLLEALREQIRRKIAWMAGLPSSSLAGYYDEQNLLARWGGQETTPVTAITLLWPCVRDHGPTAHQDATLTALGSRTLRLHRTAHLGSFRFDRNEQAVVDVLRAKPQSLEELLDSGLSADLVRGVIYTLSLTRVIDLGSGVPPPVAITTALRTTTGNSTRPPTRRTGHGTQPTGQAVGQEKKADPELEAEIRRRAEEIPKQTYYAMLGVDETADTATVQAAFFQLARRWHPDRISVGEGELRALATMVFSRMSEAHGTLTDAERRAEYDRVLKEGGGTPEEQERINQVVRAANAFQRAEILVKRGRLEAAEEEAAAAANGDPEQAEYAALHAWIRVRRLPTGAEGDFPGLLQALNDAVERDPQNVRIRFYRGQILKAAGKPESAIRDFRFVVEAQPNHVDAQREIRLYRMRRVQKSPSGRPPASEGGLLGKLFKR